MNWGIIATIVFLLFLYWLIIAAKKESRKLPDPKKDKTVRLWE